MRTANAIAILGVASALVGTACNRTDRANEPPTASTTAEDRSVQERADDVTELDKRLGEIDRKWAEMQAEVKEEGRTPTTGLRAEVREDVAQIKDAVAGLKTTTPDMIAPTRTAIVSTAVLPTNFSTRDVTRNSA